MRPNQYLLYSMEVGVRLFVVKSLSDASASDETSITPAVAHRRRTIICSVLLFCIALFSLIISSALIGLHPFGSSQFNYFVYQAQSFLHGRIDLPHFTKTDLILVNGRYYIVYPPFPAFLMMPFVAIFGLGFSDIFFTQVCSALNIVLLFWLLETLRVSGRSTRTVRENVALSLIFFFGTINFYLSMGGTMWFTAHIVAATCTLSFLILAFKGRYALSALFLGCAFLTRAPALAGLPLLLYLLLEGQTERLTLKGLLSWARALPWRKVALDLTPLLLVLLLFLVRNALAFGSPWQTGYPLLIQQLYPEVHYGILGLHYIWPDIVANFLSFPTFTFRDAFDISPHLDLLRGGVGVSVFVTTPIFLFLFFIRNRQPSTLRKVLWLVVGLVVAATLLYEAAGFYQFGARYLFEAYPYAFVLLALSEIELGWRFYLLALAGVLVNGAGAYEFWKNSAHP